VRIERIQTVWDLTKWGGDQIGHVALIALPMLFVGASPWRGALAGAALLTAREIEQYFTKEREFELMLPFWERHIDRTLDVTIGALGCAIVLWRFG
jgi:hypothetical protein